jgi:subtilisin family serine protease
MTAMKALLKLREEKPAENPQKNARIPWNVKAIKATEVWRQEGTFGQGVTVAVIDSGILPTPSLATALWKNPNETLNGEDDDDNGLVDDVFGYDFNSGTGYVLELGVTMSHGISYAGIIAGRISAKSGWQTGIAPQAELMLIKGSSDLRALEYLVLHGADLVSMSFIIVARTRSTGRPLPKCLRASFRRRRLGSRWCGQLWTEIPPSNAQRQANRPAKGHSLRDCDGGSGQGSIARRVQQSRFLLLG